MLIVEKRGMDVLHRLSFHANKVFVDELFRSHASPDRNPSYAHECNPKDITVTPTFVSGYNPVRVGP